MSLSKKTRFEVLKRDKFTCQYCGCSAPDVTLHIDHIEPKSKGGSDDVTNLITSCADCNMGKSDRSLSDNAVIKQRKHQLDELQERREQLELMMQWQRALVDMDQQVLEQLREFWDEQTPGYHLNKTGLANLKKWIKRFSLSEIIDAMQTSSAQYLKFGEGNVSPTAKSVEKAITYIPRICTFRRKVEEKPYLSKLYYIRGILRNRLSYLNEWKSIKIMEEAHLLGVPTEEMQEMAKQVTSWTQFQNATASLREEIEKRGSETIQRN